MEKNKRCDVSVIIPTYNRKHTISRAIDSVLNQTILPCEVIIVDDGSTDGSVDFLSQRYGSAIIILEEDHRGAQYARNEGIRRAKGRYVSFLDSDDLWMPNKLEVQMRYMENGYSDCVLYSNCFLTEKNRWTYWKLYEVKENAYTELLCEPAPMFQSMLVKKEKIEAIGYLDEKVQAYQEWDTSICLAKICKFKHINEPLFIYSVNSVDSSFLGTNRDFQGYKYVVEKHREDIIRYCGNEVYKSMKNKIEEKRRVAEENRSLLGRYHAMPGRFGSGSDKNKDVLSRLRMECDILLKWVQIHQNGKRLSDYLKKYRKERIAIYGMGIFGEILYEEVKRDVRVICLMDKNARNIKLPYNILNSENDIPDEVDVIIVTALQSYDEIASMLEKKTKTCVTSLIDMVNVVHGTIMDKKLVNEI